jgi:hypothetical protein
VVGGWGEGFGGFEAYSCELPPVQNCELDHHCLKLPSHFDEFASEGRGGASCKRNWAPRSHHRKEYIPHHLDPKSGKSHSSHLPALPSPSSTEKQRRKTRHRIPHNFVLVCTLLLLSLRDLHELPVPGALKEQSGNLWAIATALHPHLKETSVQSLLTSLGDRSLFFFRLIVGDLFIILRKHG